MDDGPFRLPFRVRDAGGIAVSIVDRNGATVALHLCRRDADFIVAAVNNHHALTAALEAALPHISSGIVCNQAAAALAKAKEPAP